MASLTEHNSKFSLPNLKSQVSSFTALLNCQRSGQSLHTEFGVLLLKVSTSTVSSPLTSNGCSACWPQSLLFQAHKVVGFPVGFYLSQEMLTGVYSWLETCQTMSLLPVSFPSDFCLLFFIHQCHKVVALFMFFQELIVLNQTQED